MFVNIKLHVIRCVVINGSMALPVFQERNFLHTSSTRYMQRSILSFSLHNTIGYGEWEMPFQESESTQARIQAY